MEAQAILIITELIVDHGVTTALRRLQTLDPDTVTIADLAALRRGSIGDPDCHFCLDDSAFSDEEAP